MASFEDVNMRSRIDRRYTYLYQDGCSSSVLVLACVNDIVGEILLSTCSGTSEEGAGNTTTEDTADITSASRANLTTDTAALFLTEATGIEGATVTLNDELTSVRDRERGKRNQREERCLDEHG